jgi:hypothetical protein
MSFVTGTAQRRGSVSATVGTSFQNVPASSPYPQSDLLRQSKGINRSTTKRHKTATIGDSQSTGLSIQGTHQFRTNEGTNPDGTTPPLTGGGQLDNPDFPISYNGRGTLKFVSPIRITTVDGPLNVNGSVYSNQGILTGDPPEVIAFTPSMGSATADFTLDAGNSASTYFVSVDHVVVHVHIVWTDKGTVGDEDDIFVKGLPFLSESQVHRIPLSTSKIIALQVGSHYVGELAGNSTDIQLYSTDSMTGEEIFVEGVQCQDTGSVSFVLSYHAVVP